MNNKTANHGEQCTEEKPAEMKTVEEDPWSPKGKLSLMLKSYPNAVVYSLKDHAKLINTDQVIKMSGKGCDASSKRGQ